MRIRKRKWVDEELEECKFMYNNPKENKGNWRSKFKNDYPLYIELGCGKGGFASQFGAKNIDKNLIAVDMVPAMLGFAKRKIEAEYIEKKVDIDNIAITYWNIERITEIFDENDKIERIYINFCNPWPRGKHNKRRLTHTRQLEQYKTFLSKDGEIHFKTDDDMLFEVSLSYFKNAGFEILEEIRDMDINNYPNNLETEHEKMFKEQGIKIKFLRAKIYGI